MSAGFSCNQRNTGGHRRCERMTVMQGGEYARFQFVQSFADRRYSGFVVTNLTYPEKLSTYQLEGSSFSTPVGGESPPIQGQDVRCSSLVCQQHKSRVGKIHRRVSVLVHQLCCSQHLRRSS